MNFLRQIFQDIDGCYSSKRTAFFIFVILFVVLTVLLYFRRFDAAAIPLMRDAQDHLTDLIKWLGGFIVSEQVTKFAARREG